MESQLGIYQLFIFYNGFYNYILQPNFYFSQMSAQILKSTSTDGGKLSVYQSITKIEKKVELKMGNITSEHIEYAL